MTHHNIVFVWCGPCVSGASLCLAHIVIMFIIKNKSSRFNDLDSHEYEYSIFSLNSNISEYSSTRLSPSLKIKGRRMPDIILTTAKRRETQYIDPLLRPRWLKNNYQKIDTVKSYENPTGQGINCHRSCWPDTEPERRDGCTSPFNIASPKNYRMT